MHFRAVFLAGLIGLSHGLVAMGSSFTFNELYSGNNNVSLASGSDNPVGQAINVGDSFDWTLTAQNGQWTVDTGDQFFALMAFSVLDSGTRTGDLTFTLRLNGADVYTSTETGVSNSYVHLGTNYETLTTGLKFDQLVLNYTLTSSDASTTIQQLLPIFGPPETAPALNGGQITFAAVPEPGSIALVGIVLAAGSVFLRRRRLATARNSTDQN